MQRVRRLPDLSREHQEHDEDQEHGQCPREQRHDVKQVLAQASECPERDLEQAERDDQVDDADAEQDVERHHDRHRQIAPDHERGDRRQDREGRDIREVEPWRRTAHRATAYGHDDPVGHQHEQERGERSDDVPRQGDVWPSQPVQHRPDDDPRRDERRRPRVHALLGAVALDELRHAASHEPPLDVPTWAGRDRARSDLQERIHRSQRTGARCAVRIGHGWRDRMFVRCPSAPCLLVSCAVPSWDRPSDRIGGWASARSSWRPPSRSSSSWPSSSRTASRTSSARAPRKPRSTTSRRSSVATSIRRCRRQASISTRGMIRRSTHSSSVWCCRARSAASTSGHATAGSCTRVSPRSAASASRSARSSRAPTLATASRATSGQTSPRSAPAACRATARHRRRNAISSCSSRSAARSMAIRSACTTCTRMPASSNSASPPSGQACSWSRCSRRACWRP